MRYAIYFMPRANSALWQFGSSVLGYDAASGREVPSLADLCLAIPRLRGWTSEPRRYGFHATLKAPFMLAERCSENDLLQYARSFAAARRAFEEPPLRLASFGGFLALALAQPSSAVAALADEAVTHFDHLRAPLSAQDRARRLDRPLPPRQIRQLERWGYPHVFEDFMFHMTLSNQLEPGDSAQMQAALALVYAPLAQPVRFDGMAVFVQPSPEARFRVLEWLEFGGDGAGG